MLQLKNTVSPRDGLLAEFGRCWNKRQFTDGMIICDGGAEVPFCSFILASNSASLRVILQETEENKILLPDFSYELVAGLVGLLHGAGDQPQPAEHEYAQLASLLGITQRNETAKQKSEITANKSKSDCVEDDIIITFDKGKGSPYKPPDKTRPRRTTYHTRGYRDWSRTLAVKADRKSAKTESVFERIDYRKIPVDEIKVEEEEMNDLEKNLDSTEIKYNSELIQDQERPKVADVRSKNVITLDADVLHSSESSRVEEVLRGNQSILPDLNTDSQQGGDRLDDISDHHEAHDIQVLAEGESLHPISLDGGQYRINKLGLIIVKQSDAASVAKPHYKSGHGKFCCLLCKKFNKNRRFGTKQSVVTHILKHLNIFTEECKICFNGYRSKQELVVHNNSAHQDVVEPNTRNVVEFSPSSEQQRRQLHSYHLNKTTTFMPEHKAQRVISSYIEFLPNASVSGIVFKCSLCSEKSTVQEDVFEHVALVHLNILQFKCQECGSKFKLRNQYDEHMRLEHNTSPEETLGLQMEVVEDGGADEDDEDDEGGDDKKSTMIYQDEKGTTVMLESEANETQANIEPEEDFNYEENGFRLQTTPAGTKLVYVSGAAEPLLKSSRENLVRINRARILSAREAEEVVAGLFFRNSQTKMYECTKCDGKFQCESVVAMRRHLYQHLDIYFYSCKNCKDVFRTQSKLKEHVNVHERRVEEKTLEISRINQSEMIGDYATSETEVLLSPEQAKPIIESYISLDSSVPGYNWFKCKLCLFTRDNYLATFNHTLRNHLKINQVSCKKCDKAFKLEEDLKRHYIALHHTTYPHTDHAATSNEIEDNETDFPGIVDLNSLTMAQLKGKKVSSDQARTIKGTFIVRNEVSRKFECELCDFVSDWKTTIQNHVLSRHYDIFIYRCNQCKQLMRNWNQFSVHRRSHTKEGRKRKTSSELTSDYHLLTEPLYLGEKDGKAAAEQYVYYDMKLKAQHCKMCDYSSKKTQLVAMHVLAKHLPFVHLFRCEDCGKEFRYSRNQFNEHKLVHTEGKQACAVCVKLGIVEEEGSGATTYSRETFKAHFKRFHTPGTFKCQTEGCTVVESTKMELNRHHAKVHLVGARDKTYKCHICEYEFPTKSRLKKHVRLCEVGRTRTLFRKQISDVLVWMGKGSYRCTFCQQEFHPLPGDVTMTGLPEARNHVVSVHGMRHMKRLKMQWLGEPASVDKTQKYKDKSAVWTQKVKDIEAARKLALQESQALIVKQEVSNNIARAATSFKTMMEALAQTSDNQNQEAAKSILLQVIGQNDDLQSKSVVGWDKQTFDNGGTILEGSGEQGMILEESPEQSILLSVVDDTTEYTQPSIVLQEAKSKEILEENTSMDLYVGSQTAKDTAGQNNLFLQQPTTIFVQNQVDDATVEQEEIGEEADPTGSIQEQDAGDVPIVLLPNAKVIDTPTSRPPPPPAPCPRNNSGNSARQISLLGIDHIRRMDNFEVYLQPTRKNKP